MRRLPGTPSQRNILLSQQPNNTADGHWKASEQTEEIYGILNRPTVWSVLSSDYNKEGYLNISLPI